MWTLGPRAMTTLAYAVVDAEQESLELVNAGHPPPLVDPAGGRAVRCCRCRATSRSAPPRSRGYKSESHPLPAGTALLLYTDGLVERRGESIDRGLERLRGHRARA